MKNNKIPIVGAAGNVGKGLSEAFKNNGLEVTAIDPKINTSIEELSYKEFRDIFSSDENVVYAAEVGNRDAYEENPKLGEENNQRFADFCQRMSKVNPEATIWYVGGSWTKRKPDENWFVKDDSPNKELKNCNPYEIAKIKAEENTEKLSKLINIRFLDWTSIVPNLAPNFSMSKMTAQAFNEGLINYSPGPYGRPLLESTQAGIALLLLIENDNEQQAYMKHLIPGCFTPFTLFAQTAKQVVENRTRKSVLLNEITNTPDFLKTRTQSEYLEELGFKSDGNRVRSALKKNAKKILQNII